MLCQPIDSLVLKQLWCNQQTKSTVALLKKTHTHTLEEAETGGCTASFTSCELLFGFTEKLFLDFIPTEVT